MYLNVGCLPPGHPADAYPPAVLAAASSFAASCADPQDDLESSWSAAGEGDDALLEPRDLFLERGRGRATSAARLAAKLAARFKAGRSGSK